MNFEEYKALHERIFCENDLMRCLDETVSRETAYTKTERFYQLTERMLSVNEKMNLTAVRDVESVIRLHYVDSLKISEWIPRDTLLCDVGCGAGFPSLPLAIEREDLHFFAVDSTEKKVRYVAETAALLGLSERFEANSARAEDLGHTELREHFACVTARAVSNLQMLSELCLPLTKTGGIFLSMKGANWKNEYNDAKNAIEKLGAALEDVSEFEIKGGAEPEKRCLLIIRKTRECPEQYPRTWGKIKNRPL